MKARLLLIVLAIVAVTLVATAFARQNCPAAKAGCGLNCPQYNHACDRNKDRDQDRDRDRDRDPNKTAICDRDKDRDRDRDRDRDPNKTAACDRDKDRDRDQDRDRDRDPNSTK